MYLPVLLALPEHHALIEQLLGYKAYHQGPQLSGALACCIAADIKDCNLPCAGKLGNVGSADIEKPPAFCEPEKIPCCIFCILACVGFSLYGHYNILQGKVGTFCLKDANHLLDKDTHWMR